MKKHVQTDSEWQEEMSQKIIDEIQCELYLDMPFMKLALSALSPKVNEQLYSMATDGTYIYYNPIRLIDIFKKNGMYLNRAYLHSVLHLSLIHIWGEIILICFMDNKVKVNDIVYEVRDYNIDDFSYLFE